MSKLQKTKDKLLNTAQVFTFKDLEYLLGKFNYVEKKTGKTSGSRIAFIQINSKHIIRLHKPHPDNDLKKYVRNYIIQELKNQDLL
jgi:hypothetical protein